MQTVSSYLGVDLGASGGRVMAGHGTGACGGSPEHHATALPRKDKRLDSQGCAVSLC